MKRSLMVTLLAIFMVTGLLLSSGCSRVIRTAAGCQSRVTNPAKRAACTACTSRGPRFDYLPGRRPGARCVRR